MVVAINLAACHHETVVLLKQKIKLTETTSGRAGLQGGLKMKVIFLQDVKGKGKKAKLRSTIRLCPKLIKEESC